MRRLSLCAAALTLSACAMTSGVMDAGNGVYMISARAAPIRGGTAGANQVAYDDANRYCAQKSPGQHAIVLNAQERDVYQGSFGAGNGFAGGGIFAAGNANLYFRCGT